MKRRLLTLVLVSLIVAASGRSYKTYAQDGHSYSRTAFISSKLSHEFKSSCEGCSVANKRMTSFDLTKIDGEVTKEFQKAWRRSNTGASIDEALVLIFRKPGGAYLAIEQGRTCESRQFTFKWKPNVIAIVHTHPNIAGARPSLQDEQVALKYGVPVLTITDRGMFIYDPAEKKTSKLMEGLDWLDAEKFREKTLGALTQSSSNHF